MQLIATLIVFGVVIGEFYSLGDPDWLEIKNTGSEEIEITNYEIGDTASTPVYSWTEKTELGAGSACTVEVSNRLNNKGDTIYLKDSAGKQIDCVSYGNGNGGECENKREPAGDSGKPSGECVSATIKPTPTMTARPATPQLTIKPTVTPTVKPRTPTPTVIAQKLVLGEVEERASPSPEAEEKVEEEKEGSLVITGGLIVGGAGLMGIGGYPLFKEAYRQYNGKRRKKDEEDNKILGASDGLG